MSLDNSLLSGEYIVRSRAGLGEKCVIPINPDTGSITGSGEARIAWKLKTAQWTVDRSEVDMIN